MPDFYSKHILPKLTDAICSLNPNRKQRQKVVPLASGRVLEIGSGSGLNFEFYNPEKVKHLIALEPSPEMTQIAKTKPSQSLPPIEYILRPADEIPLEDKSIDSIVITYTLCTIRDLQPSLEEMKRVLKNDGVLIFCEHGIAPDARVQKWQHRINPIWKHCSGGCNINRDIPKLLEAGPFRIEKMETMFIPGFKIASYNYWGTARPIN